MRSLKHRFRSFLRDEDGLILAEGLLMLPLVVWALVAMFIYWDVFRTINVTQKAAYGVADLLSRQRDTISTDFANGLQNVMDFLTPGGHPVKIRITSLECQGASGGGCTATDGNYRLLFSFSPGGKVPPLTEADIQSWKASKIPILNNQESVFVVETSVEFKAQLQTAIAGFMVGVEDATYGQFIVTKPRHRRLCLQGTTTCN
ncbi:TadE/TadG family type IV pilus assembly protein [Tabrizicola flagellatus]|uniref:TadE/TadG family type IV pilus assembly protein n=1 Tax=Tabrizicola flagellatus TaxID=2593021 RepID=UPI0011F10480|nr:hypothetical protein [Tabrizicola flagellatus]